LYSYYFTQEKAQTKILYNFFFQFSMPLARCTPKKYLSSNHFSQFSIPHHIPSSRGQQSPLHSPPTSLILQLTSWQLKKKMPLFVLLNMKKSKIGLRATQTQTNKFTQSSRAMWKKNVRPEDVPLWRHKACFYHMSHLLRCANEEEKFFDILFDCVCEN